MARTKNTMSQPESTDRHGDQSHAQSLPHVSVDSRSPTPRSASVPSHIPAVDPTTHVIDQTTADPTPVPLPALSASAASMSVKWIDNNGIQYPFPADDTDYDGDDVFIPVQFSATGIVSASYLNAGALSHTLKFTIEREDRHRVKALIESSPEYRASDEFKWPFVDNVATANNKDNLASAFEHVYDGRGKSIRDLGEEDLLPAHRIRPGVKVEVEFTPTCWAPKKSRDGINTKFGDGGCSLKLMGVVLLEDKYHFESPRKKRKVT